ncbi:hypothetical protein ASZ90_007139 [hydrocarbon metagenome]|uniref:Uncharacterized protein n=1 Tax=hydrocarbon metagenome TaxID=938273 RepID=A0A0W8FQB6_9ZZZZ
MIDNYTSLSSANIVGGACPVYAGSATSNRNVIICTNLNNKD